ncbi:MAG: protein kinase, partial [Planctomycetota bacterium]|nr:protein kinase [Planctomycetota bacterium]
MSDTRPPDASEPSDDDAAPVRPDPKEPERPAPSIVFPGFQEVHIVDGKRMEHPDEDDATPDVPSEVLSGREETLLGATTPDPLSGREATVVPPAPAQHELGTEDTLISGDTDPLAAKPDTALTGREATMVGGATDADTTPDTPLTGREATMLGDATPATLTGREATLTKDLGATLADSGPTGDTVGPGQTIRDGEVDTPATMGANTGPAFDSDRTPATYGGKPRTAAGSSAAFDANWHLNGRKGPFTGHHWGDFELGGILGEGGMGAVYRAMQRSLKRRVAIKVLPPNLAQDAGLLQRFHLEASTASKLSSPHIVQVYFIGEHEGHHYYAMEYVEGTDLYDVLKDRKASDNPITPDEAAEFTLQAARGLAEAGRYGIVHRDIKPPNLMVDPTGLVKIADFGIVKVLGEHQLTMTGQAVGTPAYCSPEQGRGDGDIDQRSDLYALGVVFYELACGRKPFEASTPNALIYKHCFDEPELPQSLNSAIPDQHQAVMLRLLQKKPENRYQSADELVRDLEAIKTGAMFESALANLRGTGASEAKREQMSWLQRNLIPVLIAAGAAVALAGGGGWWYAKQLRDADAASQRATQEIRPLLEPLDQVASIPSGVEELLAEYVALDPDGADDVDYQRWRTKIDRVTELESKLTVLDTGIESPEQRRTANQDLDELTRLVGTSDAAVVHFRERTARLNQTEADLRQSMKTMMANALAGDTRDSLADDSLELSQLAGEQDGLVLEANNRIAAFDELVAEFRTKLTVLDTGADITETDRLQLEAALRRVTPLLGSGHKDVVRWAGILGQAGALILRLRESLTAAFSATSLPDQSTVMRNQGDLDLFARLVGDDDRDLKRWRSQIAASTTQIETQRAVFADLEQRLDDDSTLPGPVIPSADAALGHLRALTGDGDKDVIRWGQIIRDSTRIITSLRDRCRRLSTLNPEPIPLADQADLTAALNRLEAKDGLEPELVTSYQRRLADEGERVAALRERLTVLDRPAAISPELESDLARYRLDATATDADGSRWHAKLERVRALRAQLAVLDEAASVPDNLEQLFAQLRTEVGPDAPEIQRWGPKVALISELHAELDSLNRSEPLPEQVDASLKLLAEQVGADDPTYIRFRAKVARTRELKQALDGLFDRMVFAPADHQLAHGQLAELAELVGQTDRDTQHAARRIAELDGPDNPAWADAGGRDESGRWISVGTGPT